MIPGKKTGIQARRTGPSTSDPNPAAAALARATAGGAATANGKAAGRMVAAMAPIADLTEDQEAGAIVRLGRVPREAPWGRLHPVQGTGDLNDHFAYFIGGDLGTEDIARDIEILSQSVGQRHLDHLGRKGEDDPPFDFPFHPLSVPSVAGGLRRAGLPH